MAKLILTNPQILINSVDLSDHVDQVTVEQTWADVDTTAFGSTHRTRLAGLGDHKLTLNFHQDFAVASVDQTIAPLVGLTTSVTIKPVNAATTTVNPAYTMTVVVEDWKGLDAKIGDLDQVSITWPVSGAVTRATS